MDCILPQEEMGTASGLRAEEGQDQVCLRRARWLLCGQLPVKGQGSRETSEDTMASAQRRDHGGSDHVGGRRQDEGRSDAGYI